ncbi:hypothetical protein DN069_12015 [Streptacidiphilus pinicola]|uniref:Uncharacterized protein n=1 Tax=Streptacidiphilus pinicola TaxID=2219663 RepID=A0A2X0KDY9_9ACTN|nr:hypothetical protein [Streptacidiphilus pinicola]RAG85379.1 hypothetical protein DN069_12015 [Streptacidiphilus pinicola]
MNPNPASLWTLAGGVYNPHPGGTFSASGLGMVLVFFGALTLIGGVVVTVGTVRSAERPAKFTAAAFFLSLGTVLVGVGWWLA